MRIRCCVLILLSIGLFNCQNSSKEASDLASKNFDLVVANAKVIHLETGLIQHQTIYVRDKRIVLIAPVDSIFSHTADLMIDVNGKFVLPGFWDNHVHFRGGDSLIADNKAFLKTYMQHGITTVRDAGGDLTMSVLDWKKDIESDQLIGPTIYTSGPKIDGKQARWEGSLEVERLKDIEGALDSLQKLNVDFVKLYDSTISGELYLETIREAEKRKLITTGHMPFSVTMEESVAAGIDGIEHLYYIMKASSSKEQDITNLVKSGQLGFWDSMDQLLKSQDTEAKKITFALLKKNHVFVVPTLHIGDVLTGIPETDHSEDLYLKDLTEGFVKTYEGRIASAMNASEAMKANRKAMEQLFAQLAKELNDSGVSMLAGSDSGAFNSYVYPGSSLHKELEALVHAGLSPLEALRTSAYNGARFFGVENDYGTIAVGKMADLVVLNENPLESITNTTKISHVIRHGKLFNEQVRNTLNASK